MLQATAKEMPMIRGLAALVIVLLSTPAQANPTQSPSGAHIINLPTSKQISLPVPGFLTRTNSFPATIAVSPNGRFAAILNQGYGTGPSALTQSIGVLDLRTNQYRDFPDPRLRAEDKSALQSYFVGLAFSADGNHLYASMAAVSKAAIAVYRFSSGSIEPERLIDLPPLPIRDGQQRTYELKSEQGNVASPYPAGIAVVPHAGGERLLVANHLADSVMLLDAATGQVVRTFNLGTGGHYLPREFPCTTVVNRGGRRAWVSEWNDS